MEFETTKDRQNAGADLGIPMIYFGGFAGEGDAFAGDIGHPKANCCYAWSYQEGDETKTMDGFGHSPDRFTAERRQRGDCVQGTG